MAFRHFKGSAPSAKGTEWTCPSCQAKQQGALEQGCEKCGAGKPGAAAPERFTSGRNELGGDAWEAWTKRLTKVPDTATLEAMEYAFLAGYRAALDAISPPPRVLPEAIAEEPGGVRLLLNDGHHQTFGTVDDATHATLLAALAFYRDNQLVYGSVPGQLTADQVTDLILQLTPKEEDVPA